MSLGNIFKALAPIAAGAAFGPGGTLLAGSAGTAGSAITAGALTGAGIAALSGDDPLMGAVSGGLGGYGGAGIGEAMSGTAADAALAETATGYGAGPVQFQNFADPGKMTAVTSDMFSNPISSTVAPRGTLGSGFKASMNDPKAFLSNLGGGSTGKGAAKLGAVGLPALGQAMVPEYNANPDDDPMSKYDPKRRLNLGMTTGIQNAMMRDSGLRLNQPFAQFNEGGYLPYEFSESTTMDPERFRMFMMQREMREPSRDVVYDEGLQAIENERARVMRDPQVVENERARVLRRIDPNVGIEKENLDRYNALMERLEARRQSIKNMPEGPEKEEIMRMNDNFSRDEFYYNQGGYLDEGAGDGMSDEIMGDIDGTQPVRLSEGEFVVPADVVSHLGNGDSDSGAEQLYAMMDRVRQARTGTKKQGKEIKAERLMPA